MDEATLFAYSQGNPDASNPEVVDHVTACAACTRRLRELSESSGGTSFLTVDTPGPVSREADQVLAPGTAVGRYVIQATAGAGGMGVVYAALDPVLNRRVALKLVRAALDRDGETAGRSRLLREGQALAKLSHPNVVSVFEMGTHQDRVFIAMEFVEGQTLRDWLRQPRTWREVTSKLLKSGAGLAAAHAAGIVHRDFKPDNVLLGTNGRVYVTDFGIARDAAAEPEAVPSSGEVVVSDEAATSPLTQVGTVVGTLPYLAPELFSNAPADARSDQFSFCVTLYWALYGQLPFEVSTPGHPRRWVLREAPRTAKVPGWLKKIVERGLSAVPEQRHPSMEALLAQLKVDPAVKWRRAGAAAAAAVVLVAGAGAWRQSTVDKCKDAAARLGETWNARVQANLRQAFLRTGHPTAESSWALAQEGLSAFASSWAQMRVDACAATRIRGEQSDEVLSLRMACLDRRMNELQAVVDLLLSSVDAKGLPQAVKATQSMPRMAECADVDALRAPVRVPSDPVVRGQVAQVEKEVAQVTALLMAGKYPEGVKQAEVVAAAARKVGYRPLEAEALKLWGLLQHRSGSSKDAVATYQRALWAAEAGGHTVVAAQLAGEAATVESELGHVVEARNWVSHARAFLEHLGSNAQIEGAIEAATGISEFSARNIEGSLKAYQRALALHERVLGPEHTTTAASMVNLGTVLAAQGKYAQSVEYVQRAVGIYVKKLGPAHPETLLSTHNVGVLLQLMGRYEESTRALEKAIAGREVALGSKHPLLATSREALAENLLAQGRYESAQPLLSDALAIIAAALGEQHSMTLTFRNVEGQLARLSGSPERAVAVLSATAKQLAASNGDPGQTAFAESELGLALSAQGKEAEALAHHRRCLALRFGPGELGGGALCHAGMGQWQLDRREYAPALESFRQAAELWEKGFGAETSLLARPLIGQGQAQLELGQFAAAETSLRRALTLAEREKLNPELMGAGHFALARVLWQTESTREEARTAARRAAEELEAPRSNAQRQLVLKWLAAR